MGTLCSLEGQVAVLEGARRMFRWAGAASLSQLAQEGTKDPNRCKFPVEVDEVMLLEVIEILSVTSAAQKNIAAVPVWSA